MAASRRARYGPYHRKCHVDPTEIVKVAASGEVWGKPRGKIFAGLVPAVKAFDEPLPEGYVGYEFFTEVEPDPEHWCVPGEKEWSQGRPGVIVLEWNELVAIPVEMTKRRDPENA